MADSDYRGARYEALRFGSDQRVLTITIDSGLPMNAMSATLHTELARVFSEVRLDGDTDVAIITGAGNAFSSGADLNWLAVHSPAERDRLFAEGRRIILDLLELPQPLIAAIEGPAIGFGATLALFCDVKVAAVSARIGDPHVLLGLPAGDGGAIIWPWLLGPGRAKRYLMTGDIIDGRDAERIGLVEEVSGAGDALAVATELAHRLAAGNARAIQATKGSVNKLLRDSANLVLDTSLALEKECMASAEFPDAVSAMIERLAQHRVTT
jgi:enoyl-CoA hydratase